MPSTTSLATKLQKDFPHFAFTSSDGFRWSPNDTTVFYDATSNNQAALLHELSHAILDHTQYTKDIELVEMERDAWEHASTSLGSRYGVVIADATIQDSLDSYRDWIHSRSTCPHCQATGVQVKKNQYKCLACNTQWRVNDARVCALRRYTI
ncbi:MAG TPA: hypothetical protein VFM68_01285 [Candidatus Saccharimonadales bacterium]|nr:hypothetical protein [Candidatus Saccharimonadales bacterium]